MQTLAKRSHDGKIHEIQGFMTATFVTGTGIIDVRKSFHASPIRMFKPKRHNDHDVIIFMAARAGALGILLCLLFAVVVLFMQGNPVLLFALLCAGAAIVMFVRHHLKWLATVERMRTQEGARAAQLMRPQEIAVVDDVDFREVPEQKQIG